MLKRARRRGGHQGRIFYPFNTTQTHPPVSHGQTAQMVHPEYIVLFMIHFYIRIPCRCISIYAYMYHVHKFYLIY